MSFDYSLVKRIRPDFRQINKILVSAYKLIKSAKTIQGANPEGSFTLSYEAMLKITLALMISNGYRPKIRPGHHKTLTSYAYEILGEKFKTLARTYEQMRSKRNRIIYDADSVTQTDAKHAVAEAEKYFDIIESKIASENPQQKLWKH